jgi:hypothetical protein
MIVPQMTTVMPNVARFIASHRIGIAARTEGEGAGHHMGKALERIDCVWSGPACHGMALLPHAKWASQGEGFGRKQ